MSNLCFIFKRKEVCLLAIKTRKKICETKKYLLETTS